MANHQKREQPNGGQLLTDPMARLKIGPISRGIAGFLVKTRWILLSICVLLAPAAWYFSNQLDFDRSVESMFADNDPVLEPYLRLKETFGGNEIVLAVYEDRDLLHADGRGIRRLYGVSRQLKNVEGVRGILSLAELNDALNKLYYVNEVGPLRIIREFDTLFESKPVDIETVKVPIVDQTDELAKQFREMFEGYTHSSDGQTVSIACILQPKESSNVSRRDLIDRMREIIQQQSNGQLTGEPVMMTDGFRYVERDGRRLGLNCVILLSLVMIALFRSIRWVLIPLAVMQLTLWLTRAVLVVSGFQLSMVSSMLTAIVTVIAVATAMHVILRYREARAAGREQTDAMKSAIGILFWPIVWSCCTDAAGFASLMIATVGPVQDFGVMMALASLLVLVCILLLVVPLGLLGKLDADPQKAWGEAKMRDALRRSTTVISSRPKKLALAIAVIALLLSIGNLFLKVETDFTKNFRSDTPIAISYSYVENRLGGAGVIDVIVPVEKRLNRTFLKSVEKFQNDLRQLKFPKELPGKNAGETALTKVISIVDVNNASTKVRTVGSIPLSIRLKAMESLMPNLYRSLYTTKPDKNGHRYYRVMLRTGQRQSAEQKEWLTGQIQSLANQHFEPKPGKPGPETTGFYVLLSRLVHSILRDQYWTFGMAIIGIAVVMTLAFRSLKLAMIAMVPNLLPVLVVMGSLGWLGIKINMGAAMIAAVSLGLSIDSSIHYLWSFQRWRDTGLSVHESIVEAQLRVGRAVVFSTLALVLGFSSLCLSEFVPTIYFGVLVGATMLGGLFGNLVVLPILLHLVYGRREKPVSAKPKSETSPPAEA